MESSTSGIRARWWQLDKSLRLVLVASALWFVASYFAQDRWDRNMAIVVWPIVVMIAGHFAYKYLVAGKDAPRK